jgi:hypothetical protein
MVFVGGPRQVVKTTLAKDILSSDYPEYPISATSSNEKNETDF